MHSNVNIYIACSGEFFIRRLKKPEVSTDAPGGPPDSPSPRDPKHYELVIDNDSGTYRPKGNLLPKLQTFHGLHIFTKECTDEELKKIEEGTKREEEEGMKECPDGAEFGW